VALDTFAVTTAHAAVVRAIEAVLRTLTHHVATDRAGVYAEPHIAGEALVAGAAGFAAGVEPALEALTGLAAVDTAASIFTDLLVSALEEVAPKTVEATLDGAPVTAPLSRIAIELGSHIDDGGVTFLFEGLQIARCEQRRSADDDERESNHTFVSAPARCTHTSHSTLPREG